MQRERFKETIQAMVGIIKFQSALPLKRQAIKSHSELGFESQVLIPEAWSLHPDQESCFTSKTLGSKTAGLACRPPSCGRGSSHRKGRGWRGRDLATGTPSVSLPAWVFRAS